MVTSRPGSLVTSRRGSLGPGRVQAVEDRGTGGMECSNCQVQEALKEGNFELVTKVKGFVLKTLKAKVDEVRKKQSEVEVLKEIVSKQKTIISEKEKVVEVAVQMLRKEREKVKVLEFERQVQMKWSEEEEQIRKEISKNIEKREEEEEDDDIEILSETSAMNEIPPKLIQNDVNHKMPPPSETPLRTMERDEIMRRWGSSYGGKEDKSDNDDSFNLSDDEEELVNESNHDTFPGKVKDSTKDSSNLYDDEEETINESTNQRTPDTSVNEVTETTHESFTLSDNEDATMSESTSESINKTFDSTYESETKPPIGSSKGKKTKSNKRKSKQAAEAGGKRKKTPSCCRGCSGFQRANCNLCAPCRDRPAMGGPNKLRRKCLQRACTATP